MLLASVLVLLGGCSGFDLLNATVPACGYTRIEGIAYGPLPRQKLDVYRPRDAGPATGIVVFFYGGSWRSGQREDYRFVAQALTSHGFIAVVPDYRLYPSVTFPAFVEDGARAVRWAHEHAERIGGEGDGVYLMGHSAGAYIAALLTLDEHYLRDVGLDGGVIRAAALLSGPYDFVPPSRLRGVFDMKEGQSEPDAATQPIHFVDGDEPPILLVHGLEDETVEPANARRLAARIREEGGAVRTAFYPDEGHAGVVLALAWPFRWIAPTLADVAAFFRDVARGGLADRERPTTPTP